ncbi:MAG: maleylpyruvate isomerase family mycothiol-dependent enzyme [Acidimicrobiales bacterium]|nr:maleylpyruvate isomerase family mycothiol-dependent enzyme [Acidimicrobiales bacterium]
MSTNVDKERLFPLLKEEYLALVDLGKSLDEERFNVKSSLPGWTVKDIFSHIVGTESMLVGKVMPTIELPSYDYLKNDVARANEMWVESYRKMSGDQVIKDLEEVVELRLASLGPMTQADFDKPSWTPAGPNETYGRFMRIRHFDCYIHEDDIRRALGLEPHIDKDHLAMAMSEPETGLGYIVGKRAAIPKGSQVIIELYGDIERKWLIEVGDKALAVESFSLNSPDHFAHLRADAFTFFRLIGGRVNLSGLLDSKVSLLGEVDLSRQLFENLAFTI